MIEITPCVEKWDEKNEEFVQEKLQTLRLEHSLVSLQKWESKWCKPFFKTTMTTEETLDYIRCMTITQNVNPSIYAHVSNEDVTRVLEYINIPSTATTFYEEDPEGKTKINKETVTAEVIWWWMINYNIPAECKKWHLNSLLTLVRLCEVKTHPPKKMSAAEAQRRNAELNAKRRAAMNSKG